MVFLCVCFLWKPLTFYATRFQTISPITHHYGCRHFNHVCTILYLLSHLTRRVHVMWSFFTSVAQRQREIKTLEFQSRLSLITFWLNRITHHFYVLCDVSSKISQTRSGTVWSSVEQHGRPEFKYCQEHLLFRSARNFTHIAYYSLVPGRVHKKNLQKDIINNISSNTS